MPSRNTHRLIYTIFAVLALVWIVGLILPTDSPERTQQAAVTTDETPVAERPDSIGGCPLLEASAFPVRTAQPTRDSAATRTGPGEDYPPHESGWVYRSEAVRVLQECNGWVQGAVIPPNQVGRVKAEYGRARTIEMLTFWLPTSQVTGSELPTYRVLDTVDQMSGRRFGDVLVRSFSQETPAAIRRDVLRRIMEKEGLQDAALYCSEDAMRAEYSASFDRAHPGARERCSLGAWQDGRFSSYD